MADRSASRPWPSTRRAALVLTLLALVAGPSAARASASSPPASGTPTATVVAAVPVVVVASYQQAQAGTSTDDVKAGSGTNAPGDPPAWHGALAFLGWILVALGACGFLLWILFGRALLSSSGDDDADAAERTPPDAAAQ